jgi:hypothetical protein
MKKLIIYYNFIAVTTLILAGFSTAESVPQLLSATIFYPIFAYFALLIIPKRGKAIQLPKKVKMKKKKPKMVKSMATKGALTEVEPEELKEIKTPGKRKYDFDRRSFIKLIGSGGVAVFIFSVFGLKRAQAAFFGSVPGPGIVGVKDSSGTRIDPAIKHPTDGYRVAELDDTSDPTYSYYGFIDKDGAWFIMREESTGTYEYTAGSSGFAAAWALRDDPGTTYQYYDAVF